MTHAADVLATLARQEDVGPAIDLLGPSLQPAAGSRQNFEFNLLTDYDEKIDLTSRYSII